MRLFMPINVYTMELTGSSVWVGSYSVYPINPNLEQKLVIYPDSFRGSVVMYADQNFINNGGSTRTPVTSFNITDSEPLTFNLSEYCSFFTNVPKYMDKRRGYNDWSLQQVVNVEYTDGGVWRQVSIYVTCGSGGSTIWPREDAWYFGALTSYQNGVKVPWMEEMFTGIDTDTWKESNFCFVFQDRFFLPNQFTSTTYQLNFFAGGGQNIVGYMGYDLFINNYDNVLNIKVIDTRLGRFVAIGDVNLPKRSDFKSLPSACNRVMIQYLAQFGNSYDIMYFTNFKIYPVLKNTGPSNEVDYYDVTLVTEVTQQTYTALSSLIVSEDIRIKLPLQRTEQENKIWYASNNVELYENTQTPMTGGGQTKQMTLRFKVYWRKALPSPF